MVSWVCLGQGGHLLARQPNGPAPRGVPGTGHTAPPPVPRFGEQGTLPAALLPLRAHHTFVPMAGGGRGRNKFCAFFRLKRTVFSSVSQKVYFKTCFAITMVTLQITDNCFISGRPAVACNNISEEVDLKEEATGL